MKVLVTGANGLLASNLVRELLIAGYEVRGLVRENSNLLPLKKTGIELFKGDISNPGDVHKAIAGCNIVVHAAARTTQWPTHFQAYKKENVDATRLLLDEAVRMSIERFIFVSSANAFNPGSLTDPGTEQSSFNHAGKSGYMVSKYQAQKLVLDEFHHSGLHTLVVNPTFMLGKYDAKPSSGQIILMAQGKILMGCPRGGKNFVHVADAARGIVNAITLGKPGECYLLANENLSYYEFFSRLRQVTGTPRRLFRLSADVIRTGGTLGTIYSKLTSGTVKLDRINAELLCTDNYYSPGKAVKELKMPQTPVSKAIEDSLEWFGQMGYLSCRN